MTEEYKQKLKEKSEILKAIGHPIRLCLVKRLSEHKELNVTYFTNCMDASQSSISQHLSKLKSMGIIDSRKDGQLVMYFLKSEEVRKIIGVLFK